MQEAVLGPEEAAELRAAMVDLSEIRALFHSHGFNSTLPDLDPLALFFKSVEQSRPVSK